LGFIAPAEKFHDLARPTAMALGIDRTWILFRKTAIAIENYSNVARGL
jgi:hypothetical protein